MPCLCECGKVFKFCIFNYQIRKKVFGQKYLNTTSFN